MEDKNVNVIISGMAEFGKDFIIALLEETEMLNALSGLVKAIESFNESDRLDIAEYLVNNDTNSKQGV